MFHMNMTRHSEKSLAVASLVVFPMVPGHHSIYQYVTKGTTQAWKNIDDF